MLNLSLNNSAKQHLQEYWLILFGFLIFVMPTYYDLATTTWSASEQGHGPLVLMIVLYLFWTKRNALKQAVLPGIVTNIFASVVFIGAFVSYVLGRSQDILILELIGQILLIVSLVLSFFGIKTLNKLWFPIFFMLFMVPLPGFIVDAVTMPMKVAVSNVAEMVLYWFNYPIARTGVILHMGQYQLLVADACAGMHTLISLEALGLLYLNLVHHESFKRNLLLALLIVPISFIANTTRVVAINLVTYYFGDEVGQGFIHGFAGMFLFIVALALIISIDTLIQKVVTRSPSHKIAA